MCVCVCMCVCVICKKICHVQYKKINKVLLLYPHYYTLILQSRMLITILLACRFHVLNIKVIYIYIYIYNASF